MSWWSKTAIVLANIGAINWGLATLGWNAVENLLSWAGSITVNIVYYIVAICGIYGLVKLFQK